MKRPLKQFNVPDKSLNQIQDATAAALNSVNNPHDGSTIIKAIVLDSSMPNNISHGLGRTPVGYSVIGKNANANVWDGISPSPKTVLQLFCDTDVTITLEVF